MIVESPEKAKVIGDFLGKGWRVVATKGHLLDLPPNRERRWHF